MPRPQGVLETLRSVVAVAAGAAMLYLGYRFFSYSLGYLSANPPMVTAGLMAGLAGFTFVAAATTLLRDFVLGEKLAKALEEAEKKEKNREG